MFVLDKPYISDFLVKAINDNNYPVVENKMTKGLFKNLINDEKAKELAQTSENLKVYANSEDSINWIMKNLKDTDIPSKIQLFKDKVKFRNLLSEFYPDFYYKEYSLEELKAIDPNELKYPCVIKPAVGFLSFGVYQLEDADEFKEVIKELDCDLEKIKGVFPLDVVDTSRFIVEEFVDGDEYAIDAYFDKNGEPVILNIFYHPFLYQGDVSDRIYYTSRNMIEKLLSIFKEILGSIGKAANLKNFPLHFEVRDGSLGIIPIEVNPMRFAGWCDCDVAHFAWGINPYEYYVQDKKPDWDTILKDKDEDLFYYFFSAEVPFDLDKNEIKSIDYDGFFEKFLTPLSIRKLDYKTLPLFAIVLGVSSSVVEVMHLIRMDLKKFIKV